MSRKAFRTTGRVQPLFACSPHRPPVGGTHDWQLSRPPSVAPLPTSLVPVEAVTESCESVETP